MADRDNAPTTGDRGVPIVGTTGTGDLSTKYVTSVQIAKTPGTCERSVFPVLVKTEPVTWRLRAAQVIHNGTASTRSLVPLDSSCCNICHQDSRPQSPTPVPGSSTNTSLGFVATIFANIVWTVLDILSLIASMLTLSHTLSHSVTLHVCVLCGSNTQTHLDAKILTFSVLIVRTCMIAKYVRTLTLMSTSYHTSLTLTYNKS